ncbi:hypothetical protein, partial [Azorhizobium caulinodans]
MARPTGGKGDGDMKSPKKIQDPTEAALSAIQEALTLQLDAAEPAAPQPPGADDRPAPTKSPQPAAQQATPPQAAAQPPRDAGNGRRRLDVAERRAANDDRQTIGQLLAAL